VKLWWQFTVFTTEPRPTTSNSDRCAASIIFCREAKAYACAHSMSAM
jgi:hypothetical protein